MSKKKTSQAKPQRASAESIRREVESLGRDIIESFLDRAMQLSDEMKGREERELADAKGSISGFLSTMERFTCVQPSHVLVRFTLGGISEIHEDRYVAPTENDEQVHVQTPKLSDGSVKALPGAITMREAVAAGWREGMVQYSEHRASHGWSRATLIGYGLRPRG